VSPQKGVDDVTGEKLEIRTDDKVCAFVSERRVGSPCDWTVVMCDYGFFFVCISYVCVFVCLLVCVCVCVYVCTKSGAIVFALYTCLAENVFPCDHGLRWFSRVERS